MMIDKINQIINNAYELIQKYEQFKGNKCPELPLAERKAILDLILVHEDEMDAQTLGKVEASISRFWRTALKHHFPTQPFFYCAQLAVNKHILRSWNQIVDENPGLPERIHDMLSITDEACWKILHCPMTFQLGTHETLLKWCESLTLSEYKSLVRQKLSFAKNKSVPNEDLWNVIADGLYAVKNGRYQVF
jgi:hypothetical protein